MKRQPRVKATVVGSGAAKAAALAGDAAKLLGHTEREDFEAAVAAGAVTYSATRFLGRGKYDTRRAPTIEEARQYALAIAAAAGDPDAGRVMIYAINADGRQVLVEAGGKPVGGAAK